MTRNRSARTLATLAVTVSLALAAFAGPATVLAAKAQAEFSSTPVLARVSPTTTEQASYIAYNLSFNVNANETSNISQLYLKAPTPTGWTLWAVDNATRTGCNEAGPLSCSFGAIDADDDPITLTVVYKVGTGTGNVTVDFVWSTTGVAGDKKGNSHGDAYPAPATVTVENDADFGASYPQNVGDVISDNTSLSRQNPQSTKVTSPAADIIVTVGEDSDISDCQDLFGNQCFGQASLINVDNGQPFSQGFKVEISFNQNKPGANFVHFFDAGVTDPETGLPYEDITTTCLADHSNAPCRTVTTANGKTFATIYLLENGKTFGH